jgi:hypothetical protein
MKISTIIWQLLILILGILLIFTIKSYLQEKIENERDRFIIEINRNRINCLSENVEKNLGIYELCNQMNVDLIK